MPWSTPGKGRCGAVAIPPRKKPTSSPSALSMSGRLPSITCSGTGLRRLPGTKRLSLRPFIFLRLHGSGVFECMVMAGHYRGIRRIASLLHGSAWSCSEFGIDLLFVWFGFTLFSVTFRILHCAWLHWLGVHYGFPLFSASRPVAPFIFHSYRTT